jgi:hypothetical protein
MHHDRNGCHSCPNQSSCRLDTGCQVLVAEIAGNVELLTHKDVERYRNDTDPTVTVTTRTSSGLILPSRSVQIHWQKWDKSLPLTQAAAVSGH